jgi:hypothetical protein
LFLLPLGSAQRQHAAVVRCDHHRHRPGAG